jgi:RNase H-fold protein (predicted Holliday junction resolvase)
VTVLGIDPGRDKCGVAVCVPGRVLARAIVPPADLPGLVGRWTAEHRVEAVVVGGGTGSREVMSALERLRASAAVPAVTVEEERATTLAARRRYFDDHPRRGWRRFVPLSFQVPPEPYDDYAAAVIAQRHLDRINAGAHPKE